MKIDDLCDVAVDAKRALNEANNSNDIFIMLTDNLICTQCGKCSISDKEFRQVLGLLLYPSIMIESLVKAIENCCEESKVDEILEEYTKIATDKYGKLKEGNNETD